MNTLKGKPKLFIIGRGSYYYTPWKKTFDFTQEYKKANVVLFTGGEDVSPSLYSESEGARTYSNLDRDNYEKSAFKYFHSLGVPMIGICRGAQFLTVMSGGKLVQHVSNHGIGSVGHPVETKDRKRFNISSTHHQMMYPWILPLPKFELIAWANGLSKTYLNGDNKEYDDLHSTKVEPEIVWYPETKALCIQGHPEIMDIESEAVVYCNKLAKEKIVAHL